MNSSMNLILPHRLRTLPKRYSWLDQRLIHDGHLKQLSPEGAAFYLFLLGVSDRNGISYYSDKAVKQRVALADLALVRSELVEVGLIAYRHPIYQLLSLPGTPSGNSSPQRQVSNNERTAICDMIAEFREGCS